MKFYALFTSLMVSAILLLGGSATISALTGMNIKAATMLLPLGVIAFVIVGGLRSTFVSDYAHTTIVFIIIWLFVYTVSLTFVLLSTLSLTVTARRMAHPTSLDRHLSSMPFSSRQARSLQSQGTTQGHT